MSYLYAHMARLAPALLFTVLLSACSEPPLHRDQLFAFGTVIDITLSDVTPQQAEKALEILNDDFNYMHTTWHPWQRSALSRTNSLLQTGARFSVAPSVLPLILRARELSRASDGLFNPAIGQLIKLWGFHSESSDTELPPDADAIKALMDMRPSLGDLVVDGITMRTANKSVYIDLGAFAKGYGVDVAIGHLREIGVHNAIINAGGDLRAIGTHGSRPWHIGIRHPRSKEVLASVDIQGDESVFTSGDYERYFEYKGKRYHHILDPRTGYPAADTTSVTVIHSDGATADAATTALFVAGPKDWHRIAKQMGIKYVMLVATDGSVYMNPAMASRIRFEGAKPGSIHISPPL